MRCLLLAASVAFTSILFWGRALAGTGALDHLYERLAFDLRAGKPLVATVYVALCDNDTQGIVPVKNRRICRGDLAERNLYWATSGGLAGYLRAAGWEKAGHRQDPSDTVLIEAVWRKRLRPSGGLRKRGIARPFDAFVVGLAYRGARIRDAMVDYLHAVNDDAPLDVTTRQGRRLSAGAGGHVIGYLGHNYFFDVDDASDLLAIHSGASSVAKGVFALACVGDVHIRPAIQRPNTHILVLNRQLAYPGAWTLGGILSALAAGKNGIGIRREAARAFARGAGRPFGAILRSFAHGDRAAP